MCLSNLSAVTLGEVLGMIACMHERWNKYVDTTILCHFMMIDTSMNTIRRTSPPC